LNIDSSLLLAAAAAAAGHQHHAAGTLYVVATPIGNLADITLRAIHVLGRVDAVACEDTRVTAHLLGHLGLHKPLLALHAHNEHEASAAVLARLARGESVACCQRRRHAGRLRPRRRAGGRGARGRPPGGAAARAQQCAGRAQRRGRRRWRRVRLCRLPARQGRRAARCVEQRGGRRPRSGAVRGAAPHSGPIGGAGADAPQRQITLCRELTKQFETIHTLQAQAAPAWLAADANRARGEFVLVLHALPVVAAAEGALPPEALRTLQVLLRELPLKQAVALAAELSGAPRNALYQHALAARAGEAESGGSTAG
jgi:16S rRNA (cytidine1402-2'-O)-methyltransferase